MNIEIAVPEEWTPGQALAFRQLLQHSLQTGQPVIAFARKDVSVHQLDEIHDRINALIREAASLTDGITLSERVRQGERTPSRLVGGPPGLTAPPVMGAGLGDLRTTRRPPSAAANSGG